MQSVQAMRKPKYSWKQYARTRLQGNVRFNPVNSEEVFYLDNTRGRFDIWKQTLPGSYPIEMTHSLEWMPKGFGITPDGKRMFLVADVGGSELLQIWTLPISGGVPKRLTPDDKKRYFPTANGLIDDDHLIITTDSLGATMDVAILDLNSGEMDQLTASDTNYFAAEVSPDGKLLLIVEALQNTNNNLHVLDLETRQLTLLTPHEGEINYNFQGWSADSKGFYITTNEGREFNAGAYLTVATKEIEVRIEPNWGVGVIKESRNGKWLAWTVNEDGYNIIHLKDLEKGVEVDTTALPQGLAIIQEFSRDSKYLAYSLTNAGKVPDAHILNLETMEEHVITRNMNGGIDPNDMVHPELVKLTSLEDDKLQFSGFLYKPKDITPGEKVPMVLSIHGGPESQERPVYNYNGLYQILLSMGVGVFAPNIRGSTGYGKSFQKLIHRNWHKITGDVRACAEYMKSLDWVDEERLGVYGGSFGGFATLWSVTQLPEYWKLGIDIVGPSNIITFVKAVPDFWKPFMKEWIGDPVEDAEYLEKISPINYIDKIKADMLIAQGANDPRVVQAESDQMVEKLKTNGNYVEYALYEDEGHGFLKEENRLDFQKRMLNFISLRFFGEELDLTTDTF